MDDDGGFDVHPAGAVYFSVAAVVAGEAAETSRRRTVLSMWSIRSILPG
jgi:hypothetical protein